MLEMMKMLMKKWFCNLMKMMIILT